MARGDTLAMQVTSENLCPANEFLEKGKPAARRGQPKGKTRDIQSNKEQGQTLQGPSAPLWQQLGKQQRRHQELLIKERQKQQRPEELSFGPAASWAFLTNFCQFIFGSCFGHQTLLHHEGLQGPEQSQENEDTAALESCKGTMWSDTNLQLVCGTRCRSLRRVKDEGRQVWMEYQEVTLLDNSRRFQWVSSSRSTFASCCLRNGHLLRYEWMSFRAPLPKFLLYSSYQPKANSSYSIKIAKLPSTSPLFAKHRKMW